MQDQLRQFFLTLFDPFHTVWSVCYIYLQRQTALLAITTTFFMLSIPSFAQAETRERTSSETTHTVVEGDTLSEIADRYEITIEGVRSWNELSSDLIRLGQELVVRPSGDDDNDGDEGDVSSAPATPGEIEPPESHDEQEPEVSVYLVEEADTLGCIAARFGVRMEVLEQLNHGLRPNDLRPGQQLNLPSDHGDSLIASGRHHIVRANETLASLAEDLGVTVDNLTRWNPGIDSSNIQPGQELVIWRARRLVHIVGRGEMVSSIAARYDVTARELIRWNRGLDADHIEVGQRLIIRSHQPPTESIGSPTCGRLINGRQLPAHPGYVIREPARSYATEESIEHLRTAFEEVMRNHPTAHRVRVHDLSLPEGGPIDDHRSHQSGRDVDIMYYQRRCAGGVCPLRPVLPRELALGPQWTLLEHWLHHDAAQIIFIDYGLQEVLYNYARRHGASANDLEAWFQYPRGRGAQAGVIRHYRNHFDHIHVRFRCPDDDERCD